MSVDDFHRTSVERGARGLMAEAYLDDTFELGAFTASLVAFRNGAGRLVTGVHDISTDVPRERLSPVPETAVLVVDGVFLLRRELFELWDLRIYVHVPEAITLARVKVRDLAVFGSTTIVESRYRSKYLPGQTLYRARERPIEGADLVLDNTDPNSIRVIQDRAGIMGSN